MQNFFVVGNNSVWNHRHFVISETTGFTLEVLKNEIIYTQKCLKIVKENESAWNYMMGILKQPKITHEMKINLHEFCLGLLIL